MSEIKRKRVRNIADQIPEDVKEKFKQEAKKAKEMADFPIMEEETVEDEELFTEEEIEGYEKVSEEEVAEEEVVEEPVEEEEHEISETFTRLTQGLDNPTRPQTPNKPTTSNILDKIVVDLNDIELVEKSPLQQQDDFEFVFNRKPVFQIVATQSGYTAEMSALSFGDMNRLAASTVDLYNSKRRIYETVYSKIERTSVGKMDFKTWLKVTSFEDYETFLYGIYSQTFLDNNQFDYRCPHCEKTTHFIVDNNSLVEVKDEAVYEHLLKIINSASTPEELVQKSLVHTSERFLLDDSKIIIDIYTPSLWDHLQLLRRANQNLIENYRDELATMLFIKNVFMPDIQSTRVKGKPVYYRVDDLNRILNILDNLSVKDGRKLREKIANRLNKYRISYTVKNVSCTHCGESLGDLPIDLEAALFTRIAREREELGEE